MSDVLEELVTKFTYDVDDAGLRKYLRGQEKINRNTKTMIGLNTTLSRVMRRLFIGVGGIMGFTGLVRTYRNLDLMRRSIEGLTQSTEDWEYLTKEAFRTATDIEVVAKGYRNFFAAASMAGVDKGGIQSMYSDILEAGRAVGATQPQVQGALLALEQMFSKGRVSMEELRRQLGNALPGAFEVAAKSMGVTTQQFNEMIKKGIQATDLVPKFTAEYRKTFEKAFPEAVKSLDAALVNLGTSWKLFQYDIMQGGAGKELSKFIVEVSKFLQSSEAKSMAQALGVALQGVAKALGFIAKHFKAILFFWGVSSVIRGIVSLSALRWKILDIAATIDSSLFPATSKIIYALRDMLFYGKGLTPVLQSVGKAALMVGKNFLWVTLIAGALYGLYLILEDIYTYMTHPEWDSFTKDLVENDELLKTLVDDMKKMYKEMKPAFEEIKKLLETLGVKGLELIKTILPALIGALKLSIILTLLWLHLFETIFSVITKIAGGIAKIFNRKRTFDEGMQMQPHTTSFLNTSWIHPMKRDAIPELPKFSNPQFGVGNYGGVDFAKTENITKTVSNTFQINAQNRTDAEIMAIIQKAIGGEIDTAYDLLNPTQYLDAETRRIKK